MKFPLLLLLSIFLLSSCKKNDSENCNASDQAKTYFPFQVDSYWVFENKNDSTDIDTLILASIEKISAVAEISSSKSARLYGGSSYLLKSKKDRGNLELRIGGNCFGMRDRVLLSGTYAKSELYSPFILADSTYEVIPSLIVGGKTYSKVIRSENLNPSIGSGGDLGDLYFAEGYGLIKFECRNSNGDLTGSYFAKEVSIVR